MKSATFILLLMLSSLTLHAQEPLWQGKGRIVISADGNEHDNDDWAATPMSLAILAAKGLQSKVPLYIYSDHIWGSNQEHKATCEISAYDQMRESALRGAEYFNFTTTKFICAVDNAEVAYKAMKDEIESSSEDNPLIIIAAGPMQVVGESIQRSDISNRKYITVISHSSWNNTHSDHVDMKKQWWDQHTGWTFAEMREAFELKEGGEVKFVEISNQNKGGDYQGLNAPMAQFYWLKTSPARNNKAYKDGSWDWLYTRLESCKKAKGANFDVSDAGMTLYLVTGEMKNSPAELKKVFENPTVK